jgi:hypothetical protein
MGVRADTRSVPARHIRSWADGERATRCLRATIGNSGPSAQVPHRGAGEERHDACAEVDTASEVFSCDGLLAQALSLNPIASAPTIHIHI